MKLALIWWCYAAALSVVAAEETNVHVDVNLCFFTDNGCQKKSDLSNISPDLFGAKVLVPGGNVVNEKIEDNCLIAKINIPESNSLKTASDTFGICAGVELPDEVPVFAQSAMYSLSNTQDASTIDDGWIITIYVTSFGSAAASLTYFGYKAYKKFF